MAIIGLKNLHYALMTTEDTATTAAVYDAPKKLVGVNSVSIEKVTETATLYGDNQALDTFVGVKEFNVSIELAYLPLEDEAALFGHSYSDGALTIKGTDTPPYVALLFEATMSGGKTMYVVLYKGRLTPAQEDLNTRGESFEYGLHNLEGTFVARIIDSKIADKTTESTSEEWYSAVYEGGGGEDTSGGGD